MLNFDHNYSRDPNKKFSTAVKSSCLLKLWKVDGGVRRKIPEGNCFKSNHSGISKLNLFEREDEQTFIYEMQISYTVQVPTVRELICI